MQFKMAYSLRPSIIGGAHINAAVRVAAAVERRGVPIGRTLSAGNVGNSDGRIFRSSTVLSESRVGVRL
jgi:hypothetical protein